MHRHLYLILTILAILLQPCPTRAQVAPDDEQWTDEEIYAANTAANCPFLTQSSKDIILYNNLARLYPKKFARIELWDRDDSPYLRSLIDDLNNMEPVHVLTVSAEATDVAQCWATVSGSRGLFGHDRVDCPSYKVGTIGGENIQYGGKTGRSALVWLLVDKGVPSLGHRHSCLSPLFNSVGVGQAAHNSEYRVCYVMDFTNLQGVAYRSHIIPILPHRPISVPTQDLKPEQKPKPSRLPTYDFHPSPEKNRQEVPSPSHKSKTATTPHSSQKRPTVHTPNDKPSKEQESSLLERYYAQSGTGSVSFFSAGYTYSIPDRRHMVSLSFFDFRFWMLGISPLCAEMSVSPFDVRVAYRPTLKFFIPVNSKLAITPYAGIAVDASILVKRIYPAYNYDQQRDSYLSAIAGICLYTTAARRVPLELKLEYRHPTVTLSSNIFHPQGIYLGAQIYFARTWGNHN